ncbi:MAG: membrane dipeptidase [Clostridia bacterium]|nr:membrane dipeptidase [Clostridia bacterium]
MFVDLHCDTMFPPPYVSGQFSLDAAHKMGGGVQVFACCTKMTDTTTPFETAKNAITRFKNAVAEDNRIEIVYNLSDAEKIALSGKVAGVLHLEGCDSLEGNLENMEFFYELGVRSASLTWNGENELASGCGCSGGLKPFGKEVLSFLENNHMIVDTAHLNDESFWDVLKAAKGPVIASHSCARAICGNKRNITEDMFRALSLTGGGVGINFYTLFLNGTKHADLTDVLRHIDYFINLSAGKGVGIGSDFDGIEYAPDGLSGTGDLINLANILEKEYGKPQTEMIMHKNMLDIINKI